ncbi:oligodendrocyte-myelin glycoprotein-like [Leuresthes tenuis]|uniref:oligodendrocyte-myelin glycoprotein-like n=1 Tax=Leuresthes tenuis TaxID=355514 RepID=UPI003B508422
MRSRHVLLKLFLDGAFLGLVLVLWVELRVLAVCPSACSCSHSHREVDCSWRGLRQLPDGLQHNLRSLNLSHNQFHNLDSELAPYTHLRILDLSHNRLSRLPKDLPRSLWQLHAISNRIQLLDKNDTVYQWNLQILDLSSNKLEKVIFINNTLINLCTLNFSHNHLWTLPTNLPTHLETIDLSHNLLMKVLPGSLDRLPKLTHLYLHANRFSSLPFGMFDKMTSLRIITLGNNPWACHLYDDIAYLLSWSQHTPARVLGCPCHTHPVCGGARSSRTGGWHFASYNLPPLAASAPGLSTMPPEADVTGWWYLSALLSTADTPKETLNSQDHTLTATPISISTLTAATHLTINHLPATASPATIHHLVSGTKETSPSESLYGTGSGPYVSDKSLITETSKGNGMVLATDRFFTTETPSIQTKRTTTLRTRSVRRHPDGMRNSSPAVSTGSLFSFLHNLWILSLIVPQVF